MPRDQRNLECLMHLIQNPPRHNNWTPLNNLLRGRWHHIETLRQALTFANEVMVNTCLQYFAVRHDPQVEYIVAQIYQLKRRIFWVMSEEPRNSQFLPCKEMIIFAVWLRKEIEKVGRQAMRAQVLPQQHRGWGRRRLGQR